MQSFISSGVYIDACPWKNKEMGKTNKTVPLHERKPEEIPVSRKRKISNISETVREKNACGAQTTV